MKKGKEISAKQASTNLTSRTVEETCNFLNEINAIDEKAFLKLMNYRVPCNKELADHKTVQAWDMKDGMYSVTMLGLLNGLFGIDEDTFCGHITAFSEYDSANKIFTKIIRFAPSDHEERKKIMEDHAC